MADSLDWDSMLGTKSSKTTKPKTTKGATPVPAVPKAERADKPASGKKRAKEPEPMEVSMGTVRKALNAHDPEAIITLARSKAGLEKLLATKKNREEVSAIVVAGVTNAMEKKKRDTTLAVMKGAESDAERMGLVRGFLFDYVASGNKLYASEIAPLKKPEGDGAIAPLDADTLVAAAAYLWRWNKGNPENQLDLRPEMPLDRKEAQAEKGEVPVVDAPLKTAAGIRKYADTIVEKVGAFIKGDPRGLAEFEKGPGKKDFAAALPSQVRMETLNLLVQSLFNHLKENDPLFEKFIAMKKDEFKRVTGNERDDAYDRLMDLAGKRTVRMHEREVGLMLVTREGGKKVPAAMEPSVVVKLLQEYLNQNVKTSNRFRADMGVEYTPLKADGIADRALFCAYAAYCWRIKPENRDRPAAAWKKVPEKMAVRYEVPL